MSNLDELPSWAASRHVPGTNLPLDNGQPPRRRGRAVLFALVAVFALVGLGAAGYAAVNLIGDDSETATDGAAAGETASTDDGTGDGDGAADGDTATAADTEAPASTVVDGQAAGSSATAEESTNDASTGDAADRTAADGDTDTTEETDEAPAVAPGERVDNSDGSIRYAVLEGGKLYLRGRVHSAEQSAQIEAVALGVLGPGNVINEYEVDPTTPEVANGPVFVEDVVLFEFNSIEIAQPFLPILDLGTLLMLQNPSVRITVVSRTDAVGSEAVNLEVSRQRGEAVIAYWQRQGVDTDGRVTVDARGEEEAEETDDPALAARNRRVEFVLENLFGELD